MKDKDGHAVDGFRLIPKLSLGSHIEFDSRDWRAPYKVIRHLRFAWLESSGQLSLWTIASFKHYPTHWYKL